MGATRIVGLRDPAHLAQLIEQAKAHYDAMTPHEKAEMRLAQRISWAVGEMMLEHPDMTRDQAEAIVQKVINGQ